MTAEEKGHIRDLLRVSGAASALKVVIPMLSNQIGVMLKTAHPELPPSALAVINEETSRAFTESVDAPGGLLDLYAQLYHKYFSDDDVKQMLAFYSSPIGQKSVAILPLLLRDSQSIGKAVGAKLAPVVVKRVLERLNVNAIPAIPGNAVDLQSLQQLLPAPADGPSKRQSAETAPTPQADRLVVASVVGFANALRAKIRSNTIFDVPANLEGNPSAEFEIEFSPDGEIRTIRITKSSGIAAYDAAVMRAINVSAPFPMPESGKMPARIRFPISVLDK